MAGGITIESLMSYWGVNSQILMVVVALTFATVALVKKHFDIAGPKNLLVSLGAGLIWTLATMLSMPGPPKFGAIAATWILAVITASGGWQAFKDILQKASENFGKKPMKPLGAGDRRVD